MKKHVPAVFTAQAVVDFFSNNPEDETGVDHQIKEIKQKHNVLCDRYFRVIKESRLPKVHLDRVYREYQEVFTDIAKLAFLHKESSYTTSIQEVSEVVEETVFAMWRYLYDRRCA